MKWNAVFLRIPPQLPQWCRHHFLHGTPQDATRPALLLCLRACFAQVSQLHNFIEKSQQCNANPSEPTTQHDNKASHLFFHQEQHAAEARATRHALLVAAVKTGGQGEQGAKEEQVRHTSKAIKGFQSPLASLSLVFPTQTHRHRQTHTHTHTGRAMGALMSRTEPWTQCSSQTLRSVARKCPRHQQ